MSDQELSEALTAQCADHVERCQYTSTSLFIWLRCLRRIRVAFIILPIICGALAGWGVLKGLDGWVSFVTATMALFAGLIPALYSALKLDEHLPTAARLAGEYKNLEILFGDLAKTGAHTPVADFDAEYRTVRSRLEKANEEAYTAPEWCFRAAKEKIEAGHYNFGPSAAPAGNR
jgi:hypothetical protein